jgi:hypothetical protein
VNPIHLASSVPQAADRRTCLPRVRLAKVVLPSLAPRIMLGVRTAASISLIPKACDDHQRRAVYHWSSR